MKKTLSEQSKIIGEHPNSSFFSEWLQFVDESISNKQHRQLDEIRGTREDAIDQISDWLINHHIDDKKLKRIQMKRDKILKKYDYEEYVEKQNMLPITDKTQKGNGSEIILTEYLIETTGLHLIVYRLRYNPNVNQSMKGDDVLLLNKDNLFEKVLVGESKFRTRPSKSAIEEIINGFSKQIKLPLSLTFLAQKMSEFGNEELAGNLEDLNVCLHDGKVPILNVGFLLSNLKTADTVNKHLNYNNPNFVFLSLGIQNPDEFITSCFKLSDEKIKRVNNDYR